MNIIFLTYLNRSGSTYLANILSSSEDICVCPEGDRLVSIFLEDPAKKFILTGNLREKLSREFGTDHKLVNWELKNDVFTALEREETNLDAFRSILEYYRNSNKPGAAFVMFKAERISALMGKIASADNSTKVMKTTQAGNIAEDTGKIFFLSLLRDARAVIASQKITSFPDSGKPMAGNPVVAAWKWNLNTKQVLRLKLNEKSHIIMKYESLVRNPARALQRISSFTSLDLSGCSPLEGDLANRLSEEEKGLHIRISESPDSSRIDKWKSDLSVRDVYLIEKTTAGFMQKLGYPRTEFKLNLRLEIFRYYSILGINLNRLYRKLKFRLKP